MQPTLFVVGTLADINFVHTTLEAIEINVTASNLYKINKIRYKYINNERKHEVCNIDKEIKLQGCIFALPTDHDFKIMKELIVLCLEMQCTDRKHKIKFYYNIAQIDKLSDIIQFRLGDATFSSFLKTCSQYNTLIQDYE